MPALATPWSSQLLWSDFRAIYELGSGSQHISGCAMLACSSSVSRNSRHTGHEISATKCTQLHPRLSTCIRSTTVLSKTASWQLAVVAGCLVPLLLRGRRDEMYKLIGTCFLQGWMDGEWIKTMIGADDPAEFWNGMREGAQLVIT